MPLDHPTAHDTAVAADAADAPRVATRDAWLAARLALLDEEKALTRARDRMARQRRQLPMVRVDAAYVFETTDGPRTLSELFDARRQLLVQHFMFGPGWPQGCPSCSFMADHHEGALTHLRQRDVTLVVVSRAPLAEILPFQRRMGWRFRWVSSYGTDFNRDFGVSFFDDTRRDGQVDYNFRRQAFPQSEAPGISTFWRDEDGTVYHAYSSYGRGVEAMMGTYDLLDLMPRGRDEAGLAYLMAWVRHHDRYAGPADDAMSAEASSAEASSAGAPSAKATSAPAAGCCAGGR